MSYDVISSSDLKDAGPRVISKSTNILGLESASIKLNVTLSQTWQNQYECRLQKSQHNFKTNTETQTFITVTGFEAY